VHERDAPIHALKTAGDATQAIEAMDKDVATVPEKPCLDGVFQQLQRSDMRIVGVSTGSNA
jgi:sporulation-control protein spo0M